VVDAEDSLNTFAGVLPLLQAWRQSHEWGALGKTDGKTTTREVRRIQAGDDVIQKTVLTCGLVDWAQERDIRHSHLLFCGTVWDKTQIFKGAS
jgi:hypothetical protein